MKPEHHVSGRSLTIWGLLFGGCVGLGMTVDASAYREEQTWNVEVLSHISARPGRVVVEGDYAYLVEGHSLSIIDVSDADSLTPVGRVFFEKDHIEVQDVSVAGAFAYVVTSKGLHIIDVSNPRAPSVRTVYGGVRSPLTVHAAGTMAYAGSNRLQIVDVSDPSSPTLRSVLWLDGRVGAIQVRDNLAYIAAGRAGLLVVDVSDSSSPTIVGAPGAPSSARDVFVKDNRAYVSGGTVGLGIFDITDPTSPTLLGGWAAADSPRGIHVAGDWAFLADLNTGLRIVDISDPSSPTLRATVDFRYAADVFISGAVAFCSMEYGLQAVDIGDPLSPTLRGAYTVVAGFYVDVHVRDGLAFVVGHGWPGHSELYVLDVRNPRVPASLGICNVQAVARNVLAADGYAYVSGDSGLQIVDVSDPSSPTTMGLFGGLWAGAAYRLEGSDYFVQPSSDTIHIVDATDPTSPTFRGFYQLPGRPGDTVVSGSTAYVCVDSAALHILDVSDPSSPTLRGLWPDGGWGVDVVGNIAYLSWRLQTLDVSDPSSPVLIGQSSNSFGGCSIAVSDGLAFLYYYAGFDVVDVSDPSSPTLTGTFRLPEGMTAGSLRGLAAYNGVAFVAGDDSGLWAVVYTGPRLLPADVSSNWRLYR